MRGNAQILRVYNSPGPADGLRWDVAVKNSDGHTTIFRGVQSSYDGWIPGFVYVGKPKGGCVAIKHEDVYEFVIECRPQVLMCETGEVV